MNETSNEGLDIIQFSILEEGKMIFLTLLYLQSNTSQYDFFFFYEPSQYDMIHDRKNQTQASFFTRGANLSNPISISLWCPQFSFP